MSATEESTPTLKKIVEEKAVREICQIIAGVPYEEFTRDMDEATLRSFRAFEDEQMRGAIKSSWDKFLPLTQQFVKELGILPPNRYSTFEADRTIWEQSQIVLKTNVGIFRVDAAPFLDNPIHHLHIECTNVAAGVPPSFRYYFRTGNSAIIEGSGVINDFILADMQSGLIDNGEFPLEGVYDKGRWLQLVWTLSSDFRVGNRHNSTPTESLKIRRSEGRLVTVPFEKILRRTGIQLYRFDGKLPQLIQSCFTENESTTMRNLKTKISFDGKRISTLELLQAFAADKMRNPIGAERMIGRSLSLESLPQGSRNWAAKLRESARECDLVDEAKSDGDMDVDDCNDIGDEFDDFGTSDAPIEEGLPLMFIDGTGNHDEHGAMPDFRVAVPAIDEKENVSVMKLEFLGEDGNWVEHLWRLFGYGWETLKTLKNTGAFTVNVIVRGNSRFAIVVQFVRYGESVIWKTEPKKFGDNSFFGHFLLSLLMQKRSNLGLFPPTIGRYQLRGCIGTGGESSVFCIQEFEQGPLQAMKIFRTSESFEAEKAAYDQVRKINSKHIISTNFSILDGFYTAIMPLCVGSLFESTTEHWVELALWLSQLHDNGIVHLDISPGNVLARIDGLFLVDWGCRVHVGEEIPENLLTTTLFPHDVKVERADIWIDQVMFLRTAYLIASPGDSMKFIAKKVPFPDEFSFSSNLSKDEFVDAVRTTVDGLGDSLGVFVSHFSHVHKAYDQSQLRADVTLSEWREVLVNHRLVL